MSELPVVRQAGFSFNHVRVDERVVQISAPLISTDRSSLGGANLSRMNLALQELTNKANTAFVFDGLVRNIVEQYSENFRDFTFRTDNQAAQAYLERRLNIISLRMGEHWKTFLSRCVLEYFKVGMACVIKIRGQRDEEEGGPAIKRPMFENKPYPIATLQLISATRLEPKLTKEGRAVGWKLLDSGNQSRLKVMTVLKGSTPMPSQQAKVKKQVIPEAKENVYVPNIDISFIAHNMAPDTFRGQGLTFSGMEDINLLRTIESNTSVMIKKYSMPLIHHTIKRIVGPTGGFQSELDRNVALHQNGAPDGVIVTGDNHEIKTIGSESMALRVEGYLDYFSSRACVGLGGSAELLGLRGTGSAAAYEAATQRLMRRIRFCQEEIARQLEYHIFWELLWEGGFDPYEKDEDRVYLEFVAIDQDQQIKLQTHAADLHTKGLIDHDQAMDMSRNNMHGAMKRKPQETKMFVNRAQIPLKKAGPPKPGQAKKKGKSQTTRKTPTKREFETLVTNWPACEQDIPDFLYLLHRDHDLPLELVESWQEPLSVLYTDREAMVDYVYEQVKEYAS